MTNYIERYWRDAKPEDAIKEPPMVARFRAGINQEWTMDTLQGIDRSEPSKWRGKDVTGRFCQVYDAPDPGEGWRLIDTDKDTYNQDGIEYWNSGEKAWLPRNHCNDKTTFLEGCLYRIRITPAVTYVPFTWEDREQLRGRWIARDNQELQLVNLDNSGDFYANGVHVDNLCQYWKFLDTGKPVGKEVVQ